MIHPIINIKINDPNVIRIIIRILVASGLVSLDEISDI